MNIRFRIGRARDSSLFLPVGLPRIDGRVLLAPARAPRATVLRVSSSAKLVVPPSRVSALLPIATFGVRVDTVVLGLEYLHALRFSWWNLCLCVVVSP